MGDRVWQTDPRARSNIAILPGQYSGLVDGGLSETNWLAQLPRSGNDFARSLLLLLTYCRRRRDIRPARPQRLALVAHLLARAWFKLRGAVIGDMCMGRMRTHS
jgi:hypothetical protein